MALESYDVDKALVLDNYLPHYAVTGNTLPHADKIDADGHLLERTIAEVLNALQDGGRGWAPTWTASVSPGAYREVQGAIAERCAIRYARTLAIGDPERLNTAWDASEALLDRWRDGDSVGDVEAVSESAQTATFKHGTDSRTDLNNARFTWDSEL
jgi:hypothetical protein